MKEKKKKEKQVIIIRRIDKNFKLIIFQFTHVVSTTFRLIYFTVFIGWKICRKEIYLFLEEMVENREKKKGSKYIG